jgi:alanine dehydrogenase
MEVLLLTGKEVKELLTIDEALEAVESAFREKGLGTVQMPPKLYLYYRKYNGDLRVMPSYFETMDVSGVKVVNVHLQNPSKYGLPTIMATIILIDVKTGAPLSIMDGTWITAMRTGAGSGVATKYLARKDSKALALVGGGVQARTQLMAIAEILKLEEVRVWSRTAETRKKFIDEFRGKYRLRFIECESVEKCVKGADIISTTTPVTSPIVKGEWIEPGVHINAVGADAPGKEELDPSILKRAKIVVDDWAQASHSGEVNVPLRNGVITERDVYGEIGEIVAGKKEGRVSDSEITIFDSTGLSIQDVLTSQRVYEKARKKNVGKWINLLE